MKKMLCVVLSIALIMQFPFKVEAVNLGYENKSVNKERLIYDMGTGKLNALPWEYHLAFLIGGYTYQHIPDMVFSLKTGKWVQLEENKDVTVIRFNEKRQLITEKISLQKGDWVLKNGSNLLLTQEGNVIQRQSSEWWRTETFRQIVAVVGVAALAAILGAIIANNVGGDTIISGGINPLPAPLPAKPGGPAPLPFN